jgi:hypothetical protein
MAFCRPLPVHYATGYSCWRYSPVPSRCWGRGRYGYVCVGPHEFA